MLQPFEKQLQARANMFLSNKNDGQSELSLGKRLGIEKTENQE
jgi:hypothetical protein